MKSSLGQTWKIIIGLILAIAATRFNHFGSAFSLPDASWAVFFLGGLYLARYPRTALAVFTMLLLQAGLMDSYVTTVQGVSDWCMTPAYWFLIPTYGSLWLVGRWFAMHHSMNHKGWAWLTLSAWIANSFAFFLSNASFYLVSGRVSEMTATEYISRVSEYYVSYVSMSMLYIAVIVGILSLFSEIKNSKVNAQGFIN
jgi:hypothetical protein